MSHGGATAVARGEEKQPFSPSLCSWYVIGLVPASTRDPPMEFLPEGESGGEPATVVVVVEG